MAAILCRPKIANSNGPLLRRQPAVTPYVPEHRRQGMRPLRQSALARETSPRVTNYGSNGNHDSMASRTGWDGRPNLLLIDQLLFDGYLGDVP